MTAATLSLLKATNALFSKTLRAFSKLLQCMVRFSLSDSQMPGFSKASDFNITFIWRKLNFLPGKRHPWTVCKFSLFQCPKLQCQLANCSHAKSDAGFLTFVSNINLICREIPHSRYMTCRNVRKFSLFSAPSHSANFSCIKNVQSFNGKQQVQINH